MELYNISNYDWAIKFFNNAIFLNSKFGEAWFMKGKTLVNIGKNKKAIECFINVIELNPSSEKAWIEKGIVFSELSKYKKSIKSINKALKINPKSEEGWYNKGIALGKLGKYKKEINCYDKIIELKLDNENVWNKKGVALDNLSKYQKALKCYDKSIELKLDYEDTWYNKGITLDNLGRYQEALKCYDKALELKPDDEEAIFNKGVALEIIKKYNEALKCYDKAIKLKPNDEEAWIKKGKILVIQGKNTEANICFEKALELNPRNKEIKKIKDFTPIKISREVNRKTKTEKIYPVKNIIFIISIIIGIFAGIITINEHFQSKQNDPIEFMTIDENYHHLGDFNNSNLFPEAPIYEGNTYVNNFKLIYKREKMFILMKSRDIDPDAQRGPSRVYINGKLAFNLNSYVDSERLIDENEILVSNFASIEIEVKHDFFKIGMNEIIILVGEVEKDEELLYLNQTGLYLLTYKNQNFDDIQFWDLKLKLEGKKI